MTAKASQSPKPFPKRRKCNLKEKNRTFAINSAFQELQSKIPCFSSNVKVPKIKTLKLTVHYINYLKHILDGREPSDFEKIAKHVMTSRNTYVHRALESSSSEEDSYNVFDLPDHIVDPNSQRFHRPRTTFSDSPPPLPNSDRLALNSFVLPQYRMSSTVSSCTYTTYTPLYLQQPQYQPIKMYQQLPSVDCFHTSKALH